MDLPVFDNPLQSIIEEIKSTNYKIWAKQSQAPWVTDCITAVRYVVNRLSRESFPLTYIWDTPKDLIWEGYLKSRFLWASIVLFDKASTWDLVFFYWASQRWNSPWMVKHIWIILDPGMNYFHSDVWVWGNISCLNNHEDYSRIATGKQMMESTDPRGKRP